jgi:transcriptional regulator with XRE-family HTH domain
LTQARLARYYPCPKTFISNIEQGRVNATLATLEMLAAALHCCESDLLRRGRLPAQGPPPPRGPHPADRTSLNRVAPAPRAALDPGDSE